MPTFSSDAIYFATEGKENLEDCLRISFEGVARHSLGKLVIFTARGEGLEAALAFRDQRPNLSDVQIIGVTFAQGKLFAAREGEQPPTKFDNNLIARLRDANVPVVRARLPFDPIWSTYPTNNVFAQDMSIIGTALNAFGGGMSLCFQATLMACDAGQIDWGEHVVVMSADTSLLVRAAPTDHFLTDFVVREILCKPIFLTITRKEEGPPSTASEEDASQTSEEDVHLLGTEEEHS